MFSHSIKNKLIPYLDGELNRADRSQVEKHLAVCQSCRREMESLRSLTSALRCAAPEVESEPVDLWPRVQTQITRVPRQSATRWSSSRLQMAGAFAAVLLIAVVGFGMFGKFAAIGRYAPDSPMAQYSAPAMPPAMGGPPMPGALGMPMGPGGPKQAYRQTSPMPVAPVPQHSSQPRLKQEMAKRTVPAEGFAPLNATRGSGAGAMAPPAVMAERPGASEMAAAPGAPPSTTYSVTPAPEAAPSAKAIPAAPGLGGAASDMSPGATRAKVASPSGEGYEAYKSKTDDEQKLSVTKQEKGLAGEPTAGLAMPDAKGAPVASSRMEPQIEDLSASRWRVMAQEARKANQTRELAEKFESSFNRTNRPDVGLFLLDLRMTPLDKAGLVRTADALNRQGSTSQSFWLRVGQAYEIAGKTNAARIAYERALQGSDAKSAATAKARMDRLRSKK